MERERQGAYLRAMGIVPWRPAAVVPAQADATPRAAAVVTPQAGNEAQAQPHPDTATEVPPADGDAPDPLMDWTALQEAVAGCTRCALAAGRTQTVFGVGKRDARLMVIGEAPGAEEDRRGEPFVGRAGQLLDNMLLAMAQPRPQVFIANIVKCRPPRNRDPADEEAAACAPYLDRQIRLVSPEVILASGRVAAQKLLGTDQAVGKLRGRVHEYRVPGSEAVVPLVVTYHPAYLLRSPDQKGRVWQDLKLAMTCLESER